MVVAREAREVIYQHHLELASAGGRHKHSQGRAIGPRA